MEATRRGDNAHLRTRVEPGGMDYKGYNIAVHELGHNIEQTFSLYDIDHTLLAGVPNTAFTEALAFLFQARDLELLGRPRRGAPRPSALRVLDTFWGTREIAGSALVEIDVWHWLYAHPERDRRPSCATRPCEIARETWDQLLRAAARRKGHALLGIYSHTIASPLYLFNYVLGHTDRVPGRGARRGQGQGDVRARSSSASRARARSSPDLWMIGATGKPVGAAAAARRHRPRARAPRVMKTFGNVR